MLMDESREYVGDKKASNIDALEKMEKVLSFVTKAEKELSQKFIPLFQKAVRSSMHVSEYNSARAGVDVILEKMDNHFLEVMRAGGSQPKLSERWDLDDDLEDALGEEKRLEQLIVEESGDDELKTVYRKLSLVDRYQEDLKRRSEDLWAKNEPNEEWMN